MKTKLTHTVVALICLIGILPGFSLTASAQSHYSPVMVAKRSFLNQKGSIQQFLLHTVPKDGLYRVTAYITTPSCSFNGAEFNGSLSWTDDFDSFQYPFSGLGCTSAGGAFSGSSSFVVRAKAGTAISMDMQAEDSTVLYDLFVTVERIS